MFLSELSVGVKEVHRSGLHQIIRGNGERPLLRLHLENRFGLYPVVTFATAPGFESAEKIVEASEGTVELVGTDEQPEQVLSTDDANDGCEGLAG